MEPRPAHFQSLIFRPGGPGCLRAAQHMQGSNPNLRNALEARLTVLCAAAESCVLIRKVQRHLLRRYDISARQLNKHLFTKANKVFIIFGLITAK